MTDENFVSTKRHFTDMELKEINPMSRFKEWLELEATQNPLATVMSLATVSNSQPRVRPVILGTVDDTGFYFDTYEKSEKTKEMEDNPNVSFSLLWLNTLRSVRVEGTAEKISSSKNTAFYSWLRRVRINAQSSGEKSKIISEEEYNTLQNGHRLIQEKYDGVENIPKPHFIISYRIVPQSIEFQDIFPGDLEERIRFGKTPDSRWEFVRLNP